MYASRTANVDLIASGLPSYSFKRTMPLLPRMILVCVRIRTAVTVVICPGPHGPGDSPDDDSCYKTKKQQFHQDNKRRRRGTAQKKSRKSHDMILINSEESGGTQEKFVFNMLSAHEVRRLNRKITLKIFKKNVIIYPFLSTACGGL